MDNEAIRREANRVLSDPDFQPRDTRELFDFWKWLNDQFHFKLPVERGVGNPWIWQLLGVVLKAALVLLLIVAVIYLFNWVISRLTRHQKNKFQNVRISAEERQETHERYLTQSLNALRGQNYRLAIHYLFLAAVAQVIRDSHFHQAEFMTNREMANQSDFSQFNSSSELAQIFQDLVYFDEPCWFGQKLVEERDYQAFKSLYDQFAFHLAGKAMRLSHA